MTDYIKEAKEQLEEARDTSPQRISFGDPLVHQYLDTIAKANIAIAEQLRIANLTALTSDSSETLWSPAMRRLVPNWPASKKDNTLPLAPDVAEALGIKEES